MSQHDRYFHEKIMRYNSGSNASANLVGPVFITVVAIL